ncbi:hypothetical protein [Blastopirellula sp. J2-11]|nr:hypothetical protein [Blastopirellula sp. J2-11]
MDNPPDNAVIFTGQRSVAEFGGYATAAERMEELASRVSGD